MEDVLNAKPRKHRRSREEWRQIVAGWRASGLTAELFASRWDLNPNTLRWWKSRLGNEVDEGLSFVELELADTAEPRPTSAITIDLADRVRVHVPPGTDVGDLRTVLAALETGRCSCLTA